jgi:hypothetical protein
MVWHLEGDGHGGATAADSSLEWRLMPHDTADVPEFVRMTITLPARGTPSDYLDALQKQAEILICGSNGHAAAALLRIRGLVHLAVQFGGVQALPGGYVLVPADPNQAMREAGSRAWLQGDRAEGPGRSSALRYVRSVVRVWRAMVETAPKAVMPGDRRVAQGGDAARTEADIRDHKVLSA